MREIARLEKEEMKLREMIALDAAVTIDLDDLTTTGKIKDGSYQCPGNSTIIVKAT